MIQTMFLVNFEFLVDKFLNIIWSLTIQTFCPFACIWRYHCNLSLHIFILEDTFKKDALHLFTCMLWHHCNLALRCGLLRGKYYKGTHFNIHFKKHPHKGEAFTKMLPWNQYIPIAHVYWEAILHISRSSVITCALF